MAKSEHTFYKEAKKSFLGEETFSWGRLSKKGLKYFKWALYTFLIMTSLWGCVNQFRHSTSGAVSQGLEFYSSYDNVIPNLYLGEESSHTYEIYKTYQEEDPETHEVYDVTDKIPLEFYTINPNYNPEIPVENRVENVNYDDMFIRLSDKTDSAGNTTSSLLSYVVNESSASIYLFNFDWSFYLDSAEGVYGPTNPNGIEWVLPWLSLPIYVQSIVADLNGDGTISLTDFYMFLGYTAEDGSGLLETDDSGNINSVSVFQKFLVPSITKTDMQSDPIWWQDIDNWEIVDGAKDSSVTKTEWDNYTSEERSEIVNDEVVYYTNAVSYIRGETTQSTDMFTVNVNDQEITANVEQVVSSAYDNTPITKSYTASLPVIQDINLYDSGSLDETYELYSGIGYSIVPQNKASPLYPTEETISTFRNYDEHGNVNQDGMRDANWYEGTDGGTDQRTANAGWVMLDNDGNFLEVYNQGDQSTNYLYGDTQDEFNTNLQSYRTSTTDTGNSAYYVNQDIDTTLGIDNSSEVKIEDYGEDFIGISSISEFTSPNGDSIQNLTYNSTIRDSIRQSGQSGLNSDRDIFASWGDWGDSWDPDYGPMYGLFVFPLSQLSLFVNSWFPYQTFGAWGVILGIFIITFMLRGIGLLLSMGSTKNQQKMQEVQPILAEVDAKYSMYEKSNKQMKMKKQQEKMAIYKKYEVNPFASLGTIFITLPIFLSLFTIISAIPVYKIASVGAFSFSVSAFYGMFNISSLFLIYLLVGLTVGFSQGISTKLPGWLSNKRRGIKQVDDATKKALKKQKRTQNILVGVFIFIGLTVSVLLAVYWIFSALFTITNELVRHLLKERKAKRIARGKV